MRAARPRGLALLAAALLATAPAAVPTAAQALPGGSGDPLKDICTGFLQQSGAGVSGDRGVLCACLVAETQKRLTHEEMVAYAGAAETGAPPPPAVMRKVLGIASACLARAK